MVLPDTQHYSGNPDNADLFARQTKWIVEQVQDPASPWNIKFVTHLGDLVDDGWNLDQWRRAETAMAAFGPRGGPFVLPFSVLPGNHDFHNISNKTTGSDNYLRYFGPQHFAAAPWYGGADPSGRNSFQVFQAGDFHFLHLALEWMPEDNAEELEVAPFAWASEVIGKHPGTPVILSTHEYINDFPAGRSSTGEAVFKEFVSERDQIFLVLSGHFHNHEGYDEGPAQRNDGEWHQVSKNSFGREVVETLQDFQDYPRGGDGWLRIVTFDQAHGELRFETYSPVLDKFQPQTVAEDGQRASRFRIPLNLTARLDCGSRPGSPLQAWGRGSPRAPAGPRG